MNICGEIILKIEAALARRQPFALYRLPGQARIHVGERFELHPWIGSDGGSMPVCSTDFNYYCESVSMLIDELKSTGGKTVLSRVICGDASNIDWGEAVQRLFDEFPDAFCYVCYDPRFGFYMGATPEILAKYYPNGEFETMALAGTMSGDNSWDEKNILEHEMVVDDIAYRLSKLGVYYETDPRTELSYGAIRHLMTRFRGRIPVDMNTQTVTDAINPTPAVAGYPRADAIERIRRYEQHDRGLYTGYIKIVDEYGSEYNFVNLRCLRFDPAGKYCIFSGGGITAMSAPLAEWEETEAKSSKLLKILNESVKKQG